MVVPAFGCSRDGIQPPESILFCRRGLAPILPLRRDDPAGMAAFFDVLPPGVLDRRSGAWAGIQPAVWGDPLLLLQRPLPGLHPRVADGEPGRGAREGCLIIPPLQQARGDDAPIPGPELAGVSGAGQVPSGAAAGRYPSAASGSVRRPRVTPSSLDGDRLLDGGRVESTAPGTAQLPGADRFVTVLAGASPPGNHPTTPGAGFGVITCRSLHHAG